MATKKRSKQSDQPQTKLQQYLAGFSRSTSREFLLTTRLIHDVCVAAGARGYDLRVYTPTVDADGFDVIFDDGDRLVPGERVDVAYAYTDLAILSLFWQGILPRPKPQTERLLRLRRELEEDTSGDVELPRSAFLQTPSPSALLALAGLHSSLETAWRSQLRMLLRQEHLGISAPAPPEHLRASIAREIASLIAVADTETHDEL